MAKTARVCHVGKTPASDIPNLLPRIGEDGHQWCSDPMHSIGEEGLRAQTPYSTFFPILGCCSFSSSMPVHQHHCVTLSTCQKYSIVCSLVCSSFLGNLFTVIARKPPTPHCDTKCLLLVLCFMLTDFLTSAVFDRPPLLLG